MHCIKYKSNGLKYFSTQEMIIQEEELRNILDQIASNFSCEQKVIS